MNTFDHFLSWLYIRRLYGSRCDTYCAECHCCKQWKFHDELFNKERTMIRCFYMMAIPEKRCPNEGIWRGPGNTPIDKLVWCNEHKHDSDVLVLTSNPKEGTI